MYKEKLEKVMSGAEEFFNRVEEDGKILIWNGIERIDYTIENKADFLDRIKNRFNIMVEYLDSESITDLDFEAVSDEEFDFETIGWREYFNPYEKLTKEGYKYSYLICYYASCTHQNILESIVYANNPIDNLTDMTEILKEVGEDIPGEFNVEWANHSFQELRDFEEDELFELIPEDISYNTIEID